MYRYNAIVYLLQVTLIHHVVVGAELMLLTRGGEVSIPGTDSGHQFCCMSRFFCMMPSVTNSVSFPQPFANIGYGEHQVRHGPFAKSWFTNDCIQDKT